MGRAAAKKCRPSYGKLVIKAVQARGKEGASRVRISNWINAQHEGLNQKFITKAVSKAIADKKIEAGKKKPGIFKVAETVVKAQKEQAKKEKKKAAKPAAKKPAAKKPAAKNANSQAKLAGPSALHQSHRLA